VVKHREEFAQRHSVTNEQTGTIRNTAAIASNSDCKDVELSF